MTLGELSTLAGASLDSFMAEALKAQDSRANLLRTKFNSGSTKIKMFKVEADAKWSLFFPLEVAIPFNPTNLEDKSYSAANPFVMPGTVVSAVTVLKKLAESNSDIKKELCTVMGTEENAINWGTEGITSTEERMLWHKICRLSYITKYTQKVWKDLTKKFPAKVGFEPILDEDGEVAGSVGLGWKLHQLENDLLNIKVQMLEDQFKPGGARENEPRDNFEKEKKALWEEKLIRNPYLESYTRVFAFPLVNTAEGSIDPKVAKAFNDNKKITDYQYIIKLTTADISTYETAFASKKTDIHDNVIEAQLVIPSEDPKDPMAIYKNQNRSNPNFANTAVSTDIDHIKPDVFYDAYQNFMEDSDASSKELLEKSIWAFRRPTDAVLSSILSSNFKRYEDAAKTTSFLDKWSETIALIDVDLTNQIAESIMDGEDTGKEIAPDIVNTSVDDENTDFAGNDIGDQLKELLNDSEESTDAFAPV